MVKGMTLGGTSRPGRICLAGADINVDGNGDVKSDATYRCAFTYTLTEIRGGHSREPVHDGIATPSNVDAASVRALSAISWYAGPTDGG